MLYVQQEEKHKAIFFQTRIFVFHFFIFPLDATLFSSKYDRKMGKISGNFHILNYKPNGCGLWKGKYENTIFLSKIFFTTK